MNEIPSLQHCRSTYHQDPEVLQPRSGDGERFAPPGEPGPTQQAGQTGFAEIERAAISVVGQNDMVAGIEERKEGGGQGAHTRGKKHCVLRAFEYGKLAFGRKLGWMAVAAVFKAVFSALGKLSDLCGIFKNKS